MQTVDALIEDGLGALDQGDHAQAIERLTDALAQNGEKWQAWRALGQAYLATDQAEKALEAFRKATLIRPDDADSQFGLGQAFAATNQTGPAIHAMEEALRRDHHHAAAKSAIAVLMVKQSEHMQNIGNLLAVEEYLEKSHHYDPTNMDTAARLLRYYRQTSQGLKIEQLSRELGRHGLALPEIEAVSTERAVAAADVLQDLPKTSPEIREVIAKNGENWQAWRALGFALIEEDKAHEAVDAFKHATVIRPDDPDSQYGLGLAHQMLGDHAHAIHPLEEALNKNKDHAEAKKVLEVSLLAYYEHMNEIKNLLAVEQYLEKAHQLNPANESTARLLLTYYKDTGQSGKSAKMIRDLEVGGHPVPVIDHEAHLVVGSGPVQDHGATTTADPTTAEGWRARTEANGEDWKAWRGLGFALIDENKPEEAAAAFKRATVVRFDDAESQYGFGLAQQMMGDHAHAIHPLEDALKLDSGHEKARAALKKSLLAYSEHMHGIGNLLAVEQFLESAYRCDTSDMEVADKLIAYYNETGQSFKSAKMLQELGRGGTPVVDTAGPVGSDIVHGKTDDVLLAGETSYDADPARVKPADPVVAATGMAGSVAPVVNQAPRLDQTQVLPTQPSAAPQAAPPNVMPQQPARPAMVNCPACKQLMPGGSRLCPHCATMVDPATGAILSGKANLIKDTREEKAYKVMSWIRLAFGLFVGVAGVFAGNFAGNPGVAMLFGLYGAWLVLSGLGMIFEVGWIQFITYWSCFVTILANFYLGAMSMMANAWVVFAIHLVSVIADGITMWSISKTSDSGA